MREGLVIIISRYLSKQLISYAKTLITKKVELFDHNVARLVVKQYISAICCCCFVSYNKVRE